MPWLRSRRFYAGLVIGIIPFLFLAFQATRGGDVEDDGQRVVVRTYTACIPDSLAAQRTADLVQQLPKNAVLVENFNGCCCCCGKAEEHARPSGMSSHRMPASGSRGSTVDIDVERVDVPFAPVDLAALTPQEVDYPFLMASPGGLPLSQQARGMSPFWGLLAAPLIFIVGAFDNDKPLPDGIICPDDSGLPTGPERPQCR